MLFCIQLKGPYFGAVDVAFLPHILFSLSLPHSLTCFCQNSYSSLSDPVLPSHTSERLTFLPDLGVFLACISFLLSLEVSNPPFSFY